MSKRFPEYIHITEEKPSNDEPFLIAHKDGVASITEPQDVAIYKRVNVGKVIVSRKVVLRRRK